MKRVSKLNIFYVIFWSIISFVSTYTYVLDGDWTKFYNGDLLNEIFKPLFLWMIAFFGDYLYVVFSLNKKTQTLDDDWTTISYVAIEMIFILLFASVCFNSIGWLRTICVILLFLSIMTLKLASLCSPCPRQRVVEI